jgi:ribonuclease HI
LLSSFFCAKRAQAWRIYFVARLGQKGLFAMSKVIAFTDGASANNQDASKRCGGWAAVLILVNEQNERDERAAAYKELSGTMAGATNNQAELEAVRQVLLALKREGLAVTIVTDSEYVIGVLSRHWKAARNKELIAEIKSLMTKHLVSFEKVAGHSGIEYNERADALAIEATQANV